MAPACGLRLELLFDSSLIAEAVDGDTSLLRMESLLLNGSKLIYFFGALQSLISTLRVLLALFPARGTLLGGLLETIICFSLLVLSSSSFVSLKMFYGRVWIPSRSDSIFSN